MTSSHFHNQCFSRLLHDRYNRRFFSCDFGLMWGALRKTLKMQGEKYPLNFPGIALNGPPPGAEKGRLPRRERIRRGAGAGKMSIIKGTPSEFARLLESFRTLEDPAERMMMLIEFASCYVDPPPTLAHRPFPEECRLSGCPAHIYFWAVSRSDDTLDFYFAVEDEAGVSARAFAVILSRSVSGASPAAVANIPTDVIETIFGPDLPPGKRQCLLAMLDAVKSAARDCLEDEN